MQRTTIGYEMNRKLEELSTAFSTDPRIRRIAEGSLPYGSMEPLGKRLSHLPPALIPTLGDDQKVFCELPQFRSNPPLDSLRYGEPYDGHMPAYVSCGLYELTGDRRDIGQAHSGARNRRTRKIL